MFALGDPLLEALTFSPRPFPLYLIIQVYCEMQGRENTEGSLVDRAVLALLYPGSGYSAETGGKMSNLRALTNAQVRRYHAENYVPSNVLFVLSGASSPPFVQLFCGCGLIFGWGHGGESQGLVPSNVLFVLSGASSPLLFGCFGDVG
jgi:hypothetical protein